MSSQDGKDIATARQMLETIAGKTSDGANRLNNRLINTAPIAVTSSILPDVTLLHLGTHSLASWSSAAGAVTSSKAFAPRPPVSVLEGLAPGTALENPLPHSAPPGRSVAAPVLAPIEVGALLPRAARTGFAAVTDTPPIATAAAPIANLAMGAARLPIEAFGGGEHGPSAPATSETPANHAPLIGSSDQASVVENVGGIVYVVRASDQDAGAIITYSLSGDDAELFTIDPVTGEVRFKAAPDHETPRDRDGDNIYSIVVHASDGSITSSKPVSIAVTNQNEAPVVTSGGQASFTENGAGVVYTAQATDPDAGTTLTYSLSGDDADLFTIDPATGEVRFKAAPDYETPRDRDGDNVYSIVVHASDGSITSSKPVSITVTNQNEAPVVTSADQASFAENGGGVVYVAQASDPDAGTTLTYSLSGDDAELFTIDPTTGEVRFKAAPDYETPRDRDGDNVYSIVVHASDGSITSSRPVSIAVTNQNEAPVVTSAGQVSYAENGSGVVYVAQASDPDAGTTLTYSLSGDDAELFTIDPVTGEVRFKAAPDHETPRDRDGDNVYSIVVHASDGSITSSRPVSIAVTNQNEAPVVTSPGQASFTENGAGVVYTAQATDPDAGTTLTYSLSGDDADLFIIDPATGEVRFKAAPDYETPRDRDGDNIYSIVVHASDGSITSSRPVTIAVTNQNEAPLMTSPGQASFTENGAGVVYTAQATDPDAGTTLTYSLSGDDADLFIIDPATGEVRFKAAPDHETPRDHDGDNVYSIVVHASDGSITSSKPVTIAVTNQNEAPVVTSAGQASFAENGAGVVYTAQATDPDAGTTLTYSLSGDDAELFTIDPTTGEVRFKAAPDYETPRDRDGDNVYSIVVHASDGSITSSRPVTIAVTNQNEAPVVTSPGQASFAENGAGVVYTAQATDPDAGTTITYSLSGDDAELFIIDPATGEVRFKAAPDYETPRDRDGDNVYSIVVHASDGSITSSKPVSITVTNQNEAPVVTSADQASFAENGGGVVYVAQASDPDAGTTLTYSLSGDDAELFTIDPATGEVRFKAAPDHETPRDRDGDNIYSIVVHASDGSITSSKPVTIAVTNQNEAPVVTSGGQASFTENGAGVVYTAQATDPDAGTTLTYSLSGDDADLFTIDPATGEVRFKAAPDYETPRDRDGDNVYSIVVHASDGSITSSKPVSITVTNQNEAPVVTSADQASFAENGGGVVYVAQASDPDAGTTLTYSLSGDDAELFTIDPATGEVRFKAAPDHETPRDRDGDNIYSIVVHASDGSITSSKPVTIAVTNQNEAPVVTSGGQASFTENGAGVVYTAQATDPDAGTTLTYSLSGDDADLFTIDPATGEVRFKAAPDYETPRDRDGDNIYSIVVHASDGSIASSRPVSITVTNQNEAPTGFFIQAATPLNHIANGSFEHFTEGTVSGIANGGYFNPVATGWETTSGSIDIVADGYVSPEGTWRGSDGRYQLELASATSNGTIRQTISGLRAGETYSLSFDRAGQVGQGTTIVEVVWNGQVVGTYDSTGQFSSWTHEQLNLTAAAGDNVLEFREIGADGNWAATRLDNVSLVSQTPELSINENAAAGTLVATLGGRDADAGETFTYALLDDAGGRFVIDPATGRITVAPGATIDFESTPNLSITARVTDSAGQSFDQTIAIAVNNEATTLAGTAGADTLTGTAEEDMLLGYDGNDILRGGMGNDFINGGAGNDIAVFSGDRSQYLITRDAQGRVTVADLVNGRDGTDIVVNVEQLRFANGTFSTLAAANPDNVAPTGFTIQASTPLNHIVNGSFENFSGGIIWNGDNYAYITPKATGWQTTAGTIDIVANNYSGGLGYWTTTDGKYQVELASSSANGTIRQSIDGLKAGDIYTLSFDRSGHVNQGNTIVQVIWNGVVVGTYDSTGQFSTWTHEQLNLTAAAGANVLEFREIGTDGNWAATRLDNVSLVAAAPELSINENATAGTVVGTLTGIDANAGDSLTYALLDDAGGRFAIDATTGRITVANGAVIDYESTTSLAITVRVTDAAGLTHDERITIGVNNEMATYAGTTAADTLIGDREENNLLGYEGDDTLRGNGGNDLLDGGAGTDIAVFTGNRADYDFRLNADGQVVVTDRVADRDGTDILVNIEQVKFADGTFNLVVNNGSSPSLSGTISGDYMVGNSSSETISGGEGNDVLVGGPSADNLSGGPGHDVIVLGLADGSDVVSGGTGGGWIDTIELHDVGAPTAPTGWYVELGDGTQLAAHTATGTFETGNDASGTIHFADGHTVNFDGIERISWV